MREAVPYIVYIPSRLNNTKANANAAPILLSLLKAGTKAVRPYQRKKSHRHQAEIEAGKVISQSPLE